MLVSLFRFFYLLRLIIVYKIDRISLPYYKCLSFWFAWLAPLSYFYHGNKPRAQLLLEAVIRMGPTFVKFAQIISTRVDLLPEDIATALATLQDKVPPCDKKDVQAALDSLHGKLDDIFEDFNWQPIGSASIAQVHAATLHNKHHVAVKILRPAIAQNIRSDINLLKLIGYFVDKLHPNRAYLRIFDIIEEFENTCTFECDLRNEAGNYHYMRHLFSKSSKLYVPKIYWEYSTREVLVIEYVDGIPIADSKQLKAKNVDMRALATTTVELFFTQVFEHNFFHADLHPGNLFVLASQPEKPRYAAVDYGIVGSLSPSDQQYLAENIFAFIRRDYAMVVDLHIQSGWVVASTNRNIMISKIRAIGESIHDRPLDQINCAQLLIQLLYVAREHGMIVQPQLLLLQKTLMHVEALARRLYPQLNMWTIVSPYMQQWVMRRKSLSNNLYTALRVLPELIEKYHLQLNTPPVLAEKQSQGYRVSTWLGFALIGAVIAIIVTQATAFTV